MGADNLMDSIEPFVWSRHEAKGFLLEADDDVLGRVVKTMHAGATALVDAVMLEALDLCVSVCLRRNDDMEWTSVGRVNKKKGRGMQCARVLCGKIMLDVYCIPTSCDEYIVMVKDRKRMSALSPHVVPRKVFYCRLFRGSVVPAKFLSGR